MDDAHTTDGLTPLHRSCAYRDALALGLLALRPIRLKNLTQLTLSDQLRFDGSQWQCSFSGYETKDKQPLHFALPTDVTFVTCFERYLTEHRSRLAQAGVFFKPSQGYVEITDLSSFLFIPNAGAPSRQKHSRETKNT